MAARVDRLELPFNRRGLDPYGISKKDLVRWFSVLSWLYKNYFTVTVEGIGHVPPRGRCMLVGNHSGGVALDGAMVLASMLLEMEPPRLAQAMVEKFLNSIPFSAMWTSRTGQLTGLPEHAERILRDERLLLVFPEGARGTAKLYWERNSLVEFGSGFVRLALATDAPIVVAIKLHDAGHQVIGIDRRPWLNAPKDIEVFQIDIRKRAAEEVFRKHRPEAVIHMATVTHLTVRNEDRFRINLFGTRAVFDHCAHYGAKRCIFVGRHTYYGAAADSSLYHGEEDPPFAMTTFPELADLVAADLYAGSALWRYPELDTCVLRMCYTLGPSVSGTLATFLKAQRVPMVLGFDPLYQFMHEDDAADSICVALEKSLRGVYNVAGPQPMPFSTLIRAAGRTPARMRASTGICERDSCCG
ncbi:MAG: NAD-dependent epimerase/dehydratase family protein [Myxococcales bacterium]|nr:NAD-dependent epimerase/dehydratase family protein [Myxococcales bacterium]